MVENAHALASKGWRRSDVPYTCIYIQQRLILDQICHELFISRDPSPSTFEILRSCTDYCSGKNCCDILDHALRPASSYGLESAGLRQSTCLHLGHAPFASTHQQPATKHPSLQFTLAYTSVASSVFCCLPLHSQGQHTLRLSTSAQTASEISLFTSSTTARLFLVVQSPFIFVALCSIVFVVRSDKSLSCFSLAFVTANKPEIQ
jgi:hypothetical protein